MTSLPSLKPNEVVHYNPTTHRRTVVPNHPGKDVPKGTMRAIIKQAGLSTEEFSKL